MGDARELKFIDALQRDLSKQRFSKSVNKLNMEASMTSTTVNNNEDIFMKVLRLNEDLYGVAKLAEQARKRATYPITCHGDFLCLCEPGKQFCKIDDRVFTLDQALKYFPAILFPIENEEEFIRKIYIAFCYGRHCHAMEAKVRVDRPHWEVEEESQATVKES